LNIALLIIRSNKLGFHYNTDTGSGSNYRQETTLSRNILQENIISDTAIVAFFDAGDSLEYDGMSLGAISRSYLSIRRLSKKL
jgi:hypothetical protein